MAIAREHRFTRSDPCPICGGYQAGPHGQHCYGMWNDDRTVAYCTEIPNESGETAGNSGAYAHRLGAERSAPAQTLAPVRHKRIRYPNIRGLLADGYHETARYLYVNPDTGQQHYRVRYDPPAGSDLRKKILPWQQLEDDGGAWVRDEQGVERVLYRLPELRAAAMHRPVFLTEGEKCADAVAALGLVATCTAGGAKAWHQTLGAADELRGRHVVILGDNDEDGRTYAETVSSNLRGKAASVRLVELPGLAEHGDVYDWIHVAGGDAMQLLEMVVATPVLDTAPAPAATDETTDAEATVARMIWDIPGDVLMPRDKLVFEAIVSREDAERKRGRITEYDDVRLSIGDVENPETGRTFPGLYSASGVEPKAGYRARQWLQKVGLLHERTDHYQGADRRVHTITHFRTDRAMLAEWHAHPERIAVSLAERSVPLPKRGGQRIACPQCLSERIRRRVLRTECTCLDCQHTWVEEATPATAAEDATNPEFNLSGHFDHLRETEYGGQNDHSGIFQGSRHNDSASAPMFPTSLELHQPCATCGSTRTYRFADDAPGQVRCWECDPRPLHMDPPAPEPAQPERAASACDHPPHARATLRSGVTVCGHCGARGLEPLPDVRLNRYVNTSAPRDAAVTGR